MAIHSYGISSKSGVHSSGYTLCIPPHKPPRPRAFLSCTILLASLTSKPLFFKYSFMVSIHLFLSLPIEHTLLHRLLAILFLSIISIWLNHHGTPSLILSSRPFFTLHNSLSLHLGLYPSSLYLAILRSCPSVHP